MIHLYGFSYKMPDYVDKTLESLMKNCSEKINITIIDNKSKNSELIYDLVKTKYIDENKFVNRILCLEKNVMGMALRIGYDMFPPDSSEDFFIFTDLDLIVPDGLDWIKETREARSKTKARLVGFSLDKKNLTSNNGGFRVDKNNNQIGMWIMSIDRKFFETEYDKKNPIIDSLLIQKSKGGSFRIDKQLYHLGWDLWKDDPEYHGEKVKGVNWNVTEKCEIEKIYPNIL